MNIKSLSRILLLLSALLISTLSFAQLGSVKKFDFSLLEGKVLYIPTYEASSSFIAKMKKKGKYRKISDVKRKVALYNKVWEEAMAESSYDATDYEIRPFDRKKLVKTKDKTALLLYYFIDEYSNRWAFIMATSPKKQVVASALINGLDLSEKNDVRLMMNMLNDSMNKALELNEEGQKASRRGMKSKYKQRLVDFYDNIEDKIFLVPRSRHKNPKRAAARNADLRAALKNWKLSDYEFTTTANIESQRVEGNPDTYYWRAFPYHTQNGSGYFNFILSTDGDEVIFQFVGKKRLKPSVLDKIQTKITAKAERYRKQLAKD